MSEPGVTTEYLDDLCSSFIVNTLKVTPANIGYYGYTKPPVFHRMKWFVMAFHHEVALQDGDIINIDVAIIKDGYFGDTSRMYYVEHRLQKPSDWSIPLMKPWWPGFMR